MTESNLASSSARYWIAAALVIGSLVALIAWREQPPRPKPASIPASEFSAERAWPVLSYLADTIGYRVSGTPGARRAEAYLVARLRAVPGVDVVVQEVSGARPGTGRVTAYTLRNVLARIPGRSSDAILLSAHYDTPVGSVGAGDDGVAAASLVEIVRALAAGPKLDHTVIVIINDGEEQGLLGSHGFVQHPWFRDVRAFVNLEGAGPHGKAILFQAGVGGGWLVSAYADAVPYPYGTVLAQDIFQSGAIPSDTDFRIYRDFGHLVGLDIALYRGGWAYHTQRDRTWNVSPGTVQQMGENALALARALASGTLASGSRAAGSLAADTMAAGTLASGSMASDSLTPDPRPPGAGHERAVYYDVLGIFMPHYSERSAIVLALIAMVFAIVALVLALRRSMFSVRALLVALLFTVLSVVSALVAAFILGAAAAYGAGRPMSWFAHPWWGTAAFAIAALAGALAVQWLARGWGGAEAARRAYATHAALLLFWTIVLGGLSLVPLGSAYIALWWTVGLAASLIATALDGGRRWWLWLLLGALPAAMLTLQLLMLLSMLFIPVFGRLPLTVAPDLVLAIIVAIPATAIALALGPGARRVASLGRAASIATIAAILLMCVSLLQHRYTERRAQRLVVSHYEDAGAGALRVYGMDYTSPRLALASDSAMHPASDHGERPLEFTKPVGPTGFPAPSVELISERADSASGSRTLTLRARSAGAYRFRIVMPRDRITGWSIPAELPPRRSGESDIRLDYIAPPDTGIVFSLDVRGAKRLAIHLDASRYATTPTAAALMRALPPWTDSHAIAVNGGWWNEP